MSKRNIIKIATACFWGYLAVSLMFILKEVFLTPDWSQIVTEYSQIEIIIECAIYIVSGLILKNLFVILIYLGFKFGIKRFKKDKLTEIDFKKYEAYYRDILKDYSPAELSYIDNFEVQVKNDVVASLLSLELNKNICLDNKIQILNNNNTAELSNNEKYILNSIEDGKITNFNESEFIRKVKEDAVKNELLKESKIVWRKFAGVLILSITSMALIICICAILFNDFVNNPTNIEEWKLFILVFAILLILYIPISLWTYFSTYIIKMKENSYIRTKKGEAINEKLEGLKNYLKDFSTIHEKDEKSLTLWENYLIYSVIFNQNTKIIKNICDKYLII